MKNFVIKVKIALLAATILLISGNGLVYAKKNNVPETIEIEARDAFKLTGTIILPPSATSKKKVPLVILVHSLGETEKSWGVLPAVINKMDFATLTFNLRGHADSVYDKNDKKKYWQNFDKKEFLKYPDDILSSIDYVKDNYPEVNTNDVALIGADIGANSSIIAGSKYNKRIKTLILISPTMKYKGLETPIPLVAYGNHPTFIVVSSKDKFTCTSSNELIKYAQGKKSLKVLPYGGTGINLIKNNPETMPLILDWLKENFH